MQFPTVVETQFIEWRTVSVGSDRERQRMAMCAVWWKTCFLNLTVEFGFN